MINKQLPVPTNYTIPNLSSQQTQFFQAVYGVIDFQAGFVNQTFFHFTGKTSVHFSNNTCKVEILKIGKKIKLNKILRCLSHFLGWDSSSWQSFLSEWTKHEWDDVTGLHITSNPKNTRDDRYLADNFTCPVNVNGKQTDHRHFNLLFSWP